MTEPVPPTDAQGAANSPPVAAAEGRAVSRKKRKGSGIWGRLAFLSLVMALVIGGYALLGRSVPLPVWVVAEVEARLNAALADQMPQGALALGAVDLTIDTSGIPRLLLEDVVVLKPDGSALLTLPELRLTLEGAALLRAEAQVSALRITGARLAVTRDAEGRFDFALGAGEGSLPQVGRFSDLFDLADQIFSTSALSHLRLIEGEALSMTLTDHQTGQRFELGDGKLSLENRPDELAAELALSLQGLTGGPARTVVQVISDKRASAARVSVDFSAFPARDLAAQVPLLAPLGSLDARISGRISAGLSDLGVTALQATLDIGKGALHPTEAADPVVFDHAALAIDYDPATGRVGVSNLEVQSPTLRAKAKGQSYLLDGNDQPMKGPLTGTLPKRFVTQIAFEQVMIDPKGVFVEPVQFSSGALDARLSLAPFLVEIGQLSLAEDQRRLVVNGKIGADSKGWTTAIDLTLNEIAHDKLLAIWPQRVLAKTRDWLQVNLLAGQLSNVRAALRTAPDSEPRFHLGYDFEGADARFMRTLPPVQRAKGYSTIEGRRYTMVLTEGMVQAPEGGLIDAAGSVFAVPDVAALPAIAKIRLTTRSSLRATLSLLNLPPFEFLTRADRPVDLGEGEARLETRLSLPLQAKIGFGDVDYQVSGQILDFRSDKLVPNRDITAPKLDVQVSPKGLSISGVGRLGTVPFDVAYTQSFARDQKGKSRVEGEISLSQAVISEFGLGLPDGMVSGKGPARVVIDLTKGAPGRLSLTSTLQGIAVAIPEVGWAKPAAQKAKFAADVTLGSLPKVERLSIEGAGLTATGQVTMQAKGGLDTARFDRVTLDKWLDAAVVMTGQGRGKPLRIALTGGSVDIRHLPSPDRRAAAKGRAAAGPLRLDLDRLIVSSEIALTGFRGDFGLNGGFNGEFTAQLNGGPAVSGTVVPSAHGAAVRLRSAEAGATLAAAGLFSAARGGALDLTLTPRPTPGHYDGVVSMGNIRVRNASVLAELLNAISVVGLLEQLNGQGLAFQTVEGAFLLTPSLIDLKRGSAIGASLGVSMAGAYEIGSNRLAMQGVVSPVYLLNGIGAIFTKRGEGVFGFNYRLEGTAKSPDVKVNPLSILTPGMFRGVFRGLEDSQSSPRPPAQQPDR